MFPGFNTNGLAHHPFFDALALLKSFDYAAVALTLDHDLVQRVGERFLWRFPPDEIASRLRFLGLRSVVETGARFLLDPFHKHQPNWLDPAPHKRRLRTAFYKSAVDFAAALQSDCVSIWSGAPPFGTSEAADVLLSRLVQELCDFLPYATRRGVKIAFEPEPGMFIDTTQSFDRLLERLGNAAPSLADALYLTLDVGHLWCQNEPLAPTIERYAGRLINIHLDDARRGSHEHLPLGEGEIPFDEIFYTLEKIGYTNGIYAEISRHSHCGAESAAETRRFLRRYFA
ncbi:MAG: sugar phosphate isomerase/epimerase [Planctomycetia bacterium]|nr:sugar phosphate isomerase/epimerase [Planctomycetia bacterium]